MTRTELNGDQDSSGRQQKIEMSAVDVRVEVSLSCFVFWRDVRSMHVAIAALWSCCCCHKDTKQHCYKLLQSLSFNTAKYIFLS